MGGINFSLGVAAALAESAAIAVVSVTTGSQSGLSSIGTVPTLGPYRDKQQNKPAVYSILVPANAFAPASGTVVPANGTLTTSVTAPTLYVFDAVLVANHNKSYTPTRKPLQSGYNTSDHIIKNQPQLTLEIGMSDAMAAFSPGMWIGNPSKSISAWQLISKIADNRVLFTLATRQETYTNMAIINIASPETNKTVNGLRMTVTFEQMLLATVTTITQSARPNATDETQLSTLQPTDVPTTVLQQNQVVPSTLPVGNSNSVINANGVYDGGAFSSNLWDKTAATFNNFLSGK